MTWLFLSKKKGGWGRIALSGQEVQYAFYPIDEGKGDGGMCKCKSFRL